jgi:hypothetical protein
MFQKPLTGDDRSMLAVLLYVWLGPRAAVAEIGAELLITLSLMGGGRGRKILSTLGLLREQMRRRQLASRRAARPRPA